MLLNKKFDIIKQMEYNLLERNDRMIRYFKLFDLLNRRYMKLSDLRKILSPATVAKLRKGEYISMDAIEKICVFLNCQPGDIMEVIIERNLENGMIEMRIPQIHGHDYVQTYAENEEPENGYRMSIEHKKAMIVDPFDPNNELN